MNPEVVAPIVATFSFISFVVGVIVGARYFDLVADDEGDKS